MNKSFTPKVSIVIPVYNGSNYIKEAIDSALSQTYKNTEVVVINDGSNDEGKTDGICKSYGKKIRYFLKENGGVASALNMGIEKMEGEYFSWLSHDDVYYPEKVEKQVEYLRKLDKKNVILYADYELIDPNSKFLQKVILDHEMLIKKPEYALLRGSVNGITLLIPKAAFDKHGGFDLELKCTQDYDMWKRFLNDYKFIHMKEILTKTRIHPQQDSNKHPNVTTEGNPLWISMIEEVPSERKVALEGSEYNFYRMMFAFLKNTPYEGAMEFVSTRMNKIFSEKKGTFTNIKVSVIIPFFNRIPLLLASLKSVTNQTHGNLEIILVDDCSDKDISELNKYLKEDKRIKLLKLDKNIGPGAARNRGMEIASGDYIAFLDSDDLFVEEKIETQLTHMCLSQCNMSHTSYIRRNKEEDSTIDSGTTSGFVIPKIIASCPIATPTVMLKNQYLREKGLKYKEDFRIGEDVCLWLEILRDTELIGIEEPLTIVNVNNKSAFNDFDKQIYGITNILEFILSDKEFRKYHVEIANLCRGYAELSEKIQLRDGYKDSHKGEELKTWSFSNPKGVFSRLVYLFKYQGIGLTMKKIARKYFPKLVNKIKKIIGGNKEEE